MDPIFERIKPNGDIELPKQIMKTLHLKVGEKVELRVRDREVLIKPARSVVEELTGIVKADSDVVDEVIENEEYYDA